MIYCSPFKDIADAYLDSYNPNTNYGYYNILWCGDKSAIRTFMILINFYISNIPSDAIIQRVKLLFYVNVSPNPDCELNMCAYTVAENWNELKVTWANCPAIYDSITPPCTIVKDIGWYEMDITSVAMPWFSGVSNNGILLKGESYNIGSNKRLTGGKASTCATVCQRPILWIKYEDSGGGVSHNVRLIGKRFVNETENVTTKNFYTPSSYHEVSEYSLVTFFIKNEGIYSAKVVLQISPDSINFINDGIEYEVGSGEVKALVTKIFSRYVRIFYKSSTIDMSTNLCIEMQAQV